MSNLKKLWKFRATTLWLSMLFILVSPNVGFAQSLDGKWSGRLSLQPGSGSNCGQYQVDLEIIGDKISGRGFAGGSMTYVNGTVEGPTMVILNFPQWNFSNIQAELDEKEIILKLNGRNCKAHGKIIKAG